MKPNYQILLMLAVYLLTASTTFAQKNKIIGKWSPDMKIMKPVFINVIEKGIEEMEEMLNVELTPDNIRIMTESFSKLTMEFNADGTFFRQYFLGAYPSSIKSNQIHNYQNQ